MKFSYLPSDLVGVVVDELKDGIIEVRPGVPCLDLGKKGYAMVHIGVIDVNHYVKGMALYSDKIPNQYYIVCYIRPGIEGAYRLVRLREKRKKPYAIMEKIETDSSGWEEWGSQLRLAYPKLGETEVVP